MNKRRSLDDTCDIFLSRRSGRFPLDNQRAASEFPEHVPTLCPESIGIPPYFIFPRPVEMPELSATTSSSASAKSLPLPGSSGAVQAKPMRLANGRRHIPRPRNPFILFRCDFVHQRKTLPRSDLDDTNISRIAGDIWREMTAAQKKPWVELAAQEKARHALLYPDYKYAPASSGSKSKKRKNHGAFPEDRSRSQVSRMGASEPSDHPKTRRQAERPRPYPQRIPRRHSSSCPPSGAIPVPPHPQLEGWVPTSSQDDMQRQPSRTIMYQSVAPSSAPGPVTPMPTGYNPLLLPQGPDWLNFPQPDPLQLSLAYALPVQNTSPESYAPPNCNFFPYEPTFLYNKGDCESTLHELKGMGCSAVDAAFMDPFSTLATLPVDDASLWALSTAMSPFDCSGCSTGSPFTPSSGTLSSN